MHGTGHVTPDTRKFSSDKYHESWVVLYSIWFTPHHGVPGSRWATFSLIYSAPATRCYWGRYRHVISCCCHVISVQKSRDSEFLLVTTRSPKLGVLRCVVLYQTAVCFSCPADHLTMCFTDFHRPLCRYASLSPSCEIISAARYILVPCSDSPCRFSLTKVSERLTVLTRLLGWGALFGTSLKWLQFPLVGPLPSLALSPDWTCTTATLFNSGLCHALLRPLFFPTLKRKIRHSRPSVTRAVRETETGTLQVSLK